MNTRILIILLSFSVTAFAGTVVTSPESGIRAIIIQDIDAVTKVYGGSEVFDKISDMKASGVALVNPWE
jgi:hypothetical protein